MVLHHHPLTLASRKLWKIILRKLQIQYQLSKRHVGDPYSIQMQNIPPIFMRDHANAVESFQDTIVLARKIFELAVISVPHDFLSFALQSFVVDFQGNSDDNNSYEYGSRLRDQEMCRPGERDIEFLELLRACLPTISDPLHYLVLPLDFTLKPEENIRWLLRKSCNISRATANCELKNATDESELLNGLWIKNFDGCVWEEILRDLSNKCIFLKDGFSDCFSLLVQIPMARFSYRLINTGIKCWSWVLENRNIY